MHEEGENSENRKKRKALGASDAGICPVCDADCRVLILGTAPSKKSREVGFYYGHPQNRFWKMACSSDGREGSPKHRGKEGTAACAIPIALHDVIHSCDIIGSSDSSIKNVEPADLERILAVTGRGRLSSATAARPINYIENIRRSDWGFLRCSFPRPALPMRHGIWSGSLRHGARCFCPF